MWQTKGHDRAITTLKRSLESDRLAHAYVLAGPRHVGKMTLAMDMAKAVNCLGRISPCGECVQCKRIDRKLHADLQVVSVGSSALNGLRGPVAIGIDRVREIQRDANLKPFEGSHKVFIFEEADYMTEEAANSLLKILEEPPSHVLLLLLASATQALLPTIVSRCQVLELRPLSSTVISNELKNNHGLDPSHSDEIARLSSGKLGWAISVSENLGLLEELKYKAEFFRDIVAADLEERFKYAASLAASIAKNRDSGRQELESWLIWWRDVLLVKNGVAQYVTNISNLHIFEAVALSIKSAQISWAISSTNRALEQIERNANSRLALENLMLNLPRYLLS